MANGEMRLSELRVWLTANGFRIASNSIRARDNECHWYAYRRSALQARECECNDGKPAQIVVEPSAYTLGGVTRESVEIGVRGEYADDWWDIKAYGVRPNDVPERLPPIEASLIRAWNALSHEPA
jgi:hypothetical protein